MKKFLQKRIAALRVRGFTLIETLVAISILMIAVVVPLSIVAGALQSSFLARDQITSVYLAQDALEFVKNKRDSIGIDSVTHGSTPLSWIGLSECVIDPGGAGPCRIDTTTVEGSITALGGGPNAVDDKHLLVNNNNLYTYDQNQTTPSRFTRTIGISTVNNDEAKVTVTIQWTTNNVGSPAKQFQVSENLYNLWKQ